MHDNIKYSDYHKTEARAVRRASDVIEKKVKYLSPKTRHSIILEYFLRYKYMK